jgi:hypothetical protein
MLTSNAKIITPDLAYECYEELIGTWERLEWAIEQCGEDPDKYDIDASWGVPPLTAISECYECGEWHDDDELDEDMHCPNCSE